MILVDRILVDRILVDRILTNKRRSEQISDALDEQQDAIGLCEGSQADQFHEDDRSQSVIGRDEETEERGED